MAGAWNDGWRRALRAPWIVIGLWLMTLLLALPMAIVLRGMLAEHLGSSLAAGPAASGVNFDWWNEFLAQTAGLGQTFVPTIIGFAAVIKNMSSLADATALPVEIAAVIAMAIVISIFLMGGVLDRLARDRAIGTHGFFSACGVFFFRFLRLGFIAGALYWALFAWLHPYLFDTAFPYFTRDLTEERLAFAYRVVLYLIFGGTLAGINLIFDYAKIRMVVEDRRSALGSLTAALRFVARQPGATITLYLLNAAVFLVVVGLYALIAPGASDGAWAWMALLIGQLYIVLRVIVRLAFAGSQLALFQSRLAHAGYTARAATVWPDSPAAEAIRPD